MSFGQAEPDPDPPWGGYGMGGPMFNTIDWDLLDPVLQDLCDMIQLPEVFPGSVLPEHLAS